MISDKNWKKGKLKHFLEFLSFSTFFITFFSITIYLIARIFLFLLTDYSWLERVIALLLLLAESFILIHSMGYFFNVYMVKKEKKNTIRTSKTDLKVLTYYPPLAFIVASYKEPIPVLTETLTCFYNISYPNKHLYLLDDTRYELSWDTPENKENYRKAIEELCQWFGVNLFRSQWHGAKAGKINDFLEHLSGKEKSGFELHWNEEKEKKEMEKYLIVFDADMNPIPNFAEDLVALMENNPRIAFIQTPQYYTNFETNRVAHASGVQQAIFYEYICEGKSLKDAMFCCGTNVLFRIQALLDVNGFDETSVTEDFATSVNLHGKGWGSIYVNKVLAFGMGPEDLGAFFKQQFRWATGTISILRQLPKKLFGKKHFTLSQKWEYFLASTHYLVGWVFFVMFICPILYLVFDLPRYLAYPEIYLSVYGTYIVVSSVMFFWTMSEKKYSVIDLLPALLINAVSFPVYMKASFYALLGLKTQFVITPKGGVNILSFRSLIPQLLVSLGCIFALTWGAQRLYYESESTYGILVNMFWSVYNYITITFFLYFNHSEANAESTTQTT